ncbi:MAG: DUF4097 family beta strand repeat protein, partial [Kiritimatiellae bacterium]|nr:DUF4097 family beta strand repeat protein [Kiritimatiellia bacterium]
DDCRDAEYTVRDAGEAVSGRMSFPAAGLHQVDIQLDADDVYIEAAQGNEVETLWEARNTDGEPVLEMSGHTLSIRRKNPDVFKTFFSVFSKNGGKITVRVPVGYAASYKVSTTSGDVMLRGVDADDVKVTTTSGCVRVETLTSARVQSVSVTTVSGHAAVSACADDIAVTTVSGAPHRPSGWGTFGDIRTLPPNTAAGFSLRCIFFFRLHWASRFLSPR